MRRRRVRGEYQGQVIAYRLVGPDGTTVVEDSELISHKKRFFEFVPMSAGEYSHDQAFRNKGISQTFCRKDHG